MGKAKKEGTARRKKERGRRNHTPCVRCMRREIEDTGLARPHECYEQEGMIGGACQRCANLSRRCDYVTGTHADLYHRLRNPIFNRMRFRIIAVLQNELPNDRPIKKKPSDSAVDIDNEDGDDAGATAATFVEPKTKPKRKRARLANTSTAGQSHTNQDDQVDGSRPPRAFAAAPVAVATHMEPAPESNLPSTPAGPVPAGGSASTSLPSRAHSNESNDPPSTPAGPVPAGGSASTSLPSRAHSNDSDDPPSTPAGPVPFDGVTAPAASMRSVAIKAEDYERVSSPLSTNETYEQDRDNRPFTMDILHELMATYDGWSQNDLTEEEKEVDRRKAAIVVSRLKREDDAPVEVLDDLIRQYRSMDSGELANEEELLEIRKIALTISRGKFASSK